MLPSPIILNRNIEPIYNDILTPPYVRYRGNSNGTVNRQATLGTEYKFFDQQNSRVIFYAYSWFSFGMPGALGKKLFFRYNYKNGYNAGCQISPWNGGQLFNIQTSGNTWHEVRVEYATTATGTHRWYIDNVLRYQGTKYADMDMFFSIPGGSNEFLFDVGNRGGTLPAGYIWWPDGKNV